MLAPGISHPAGPGALLFSVVCESEVPLLGARSRLAAASAVYDVVTSLVPSETKSSPAAVGATRSKLPLKGGTWEDTVTSPRLFRRSDVTRDGNPHPPAPNHTHTHTLPLRGRRLALPPARSHVRSRGPPHSRRCQRLRRKALASVQLAVFRFMLCHMRVARAQAGDPHTTDRTSILSPVMRDLLC